MEKLFIILLTFVLYSVILYPVGILFVKLGFKKIGLRYISMSFWQSRAYKFCPDVDKCKEINCGNWTCKKYSRKNIKKKTPGNFTK